MTKASERPDERGRNYTPHPLPTRSCDLAWTLCGVLALYEAVFRFSQVRITGTSPYVSKADYPKEGDQISCPHFSISIRQRSRRQSAVAGAAYQSGERLFSEYDGKTKNYSYKEKEVIAKGILLPSNAPPEYKDRETLWNAVEKNESNWNAQLSRNLIIALPNEIPKEDYDALVRDYLSKQFVSRGMIVDYAIHDKGDGNPHVHVLLTMRALDENGRWMPKCRKEYVLDDKGEKIRLPSGEWKSRKVNTVDWDDRGNAEKWREAWAETVNHCYEEHGLSIRLDLRSFERQGRDEIPTVHLGPAVTHMEEKGIRTEIGDYNRAIRNHNAALENLKKLIGELSKWLKDTIEKLAALTQKEETQPTILDFIHAYDRMRKEGRTEWSGKSKQTASVNDLKFTSQVFMWMEKTKIYTLEDLNAAVSEHGADFKKLSENAKAIRKIETAMKHIETILSLKPIHDQSKRGFERQKERYAALHKEELERFNKALRYLKANGLIVDDRERLSKERAAFIKENGRIEEKLRDAELDPEMTAQIRYRVNRVLEAGELPNHETTMKERLEKPTPRVSTRQKTEREKTQEKE